MKSEKLLRSRNNQRRDSPSLSSWVQMHRRTALQSWQRLLKTPASSFATIFVIAVGLLLPALLYGVSSNLSSVLDNLNGSAQISLFMDRGSTASELRLVREDLLFDDAISNVELISSEQALEEFSAATGLSEISQQLSDNPLPATLVVTPMDADPQSVATLAARLGATPHVELVQVDSQWIQRLTAVSRLVAVSGQILTIVIVLGLFFIVGNTIRLAIENRRDEIRVVKLVGGTDAFAARPFLYAGMYYGLGGGMLATMLQFAVVIGFNSALQDLLQLYESNFHLQGFGFTSIAALVLGGGAIGWLGALLASFRQIAAIDP
ncbi:MAG: ABC transporter permease [Proteobacteria bacterium]|nr:ABC transporter permease [Pseudomonadota bacterium]